MENLTKRPRKWVARLRVPADVTQALGKSVFSWSTGEKDPHRAAVKAKPVIARWKAEIEAARRGALTPLRCELRDLTAALRQEERTGGENMDLALTQIVDFVRTRFARQIDQAAYSRALEHFEGDEGSALAAVLPPDGKLMLSELMDTRTPFLAHLEEWFSGLTMKPRQAGEYRRDVERFGAGRFIEELEGKEVQAWIDGLARAGDSPERLSCVRSYWTWLQSHGHAAEDRDPLSKRRIPAARPGSIVKRQAFTAGEVVTLHSAALEKGDQAPADLVALAAYTGGRIEELCSLTAKHVRLNGEDGKPVLLIPGTKTDAAPRTVPMHPGLVPIVRRLVNEAQGKERWLVHSTAENKNGDRSPPLSKRFGRLKTMQGFGEAHVFHSIRKTLASLLHNAGCPEPIAADIIGHELETMTYGVYSAGSTMATRREWLEKAVKFTLGKEPAGVPQRAADAD